MRLFFQLHPLMQLLVLTALENHIIVVFSKLIQGLMSLMNCLFKQIKTKISFRRDIQIKHGPEQKYEDITDTYCTFRK